MKGRSSVAASMSVSRLLPTLMLAAAWALACGSQPPRAQMALKVMSSRIFKSSAPRV